MNRRSFVSMLTGAAGAPLIAWRRPKPVIFVPPARAWEWEGGVVWRHPDPSFLTLLQNINRDIELVAGIPVQYLGREIAMPAILRSV